MTHKLPTPRPAAIASLQSLQVKREFLRLRISVFGPGRLGREACAYYLGIADTTIWRWESTHPKHPQEPRPRDMLALRNLYRERLGMAA